MKIVITTIKGDKIITPNATDYNHTKGGILVVTPKNKFFVPYMNLAIIQITDDDAPGEVTV